jgi:hypothetical protein
MSAQGWSLLATTLGISEAFVSTLKALANGHEVG